MAKFEVPVVRILSVENHPNADRLSIVKVLGFTCISGKLPDGSHRYATGDLIVYIPEAAVLPEWMLKHLDFWSDEKGKGTLAGSNGDRVKAMKLRGILSQGVLFPVASWGLGEYSVMNHETNKNVVEGDDVSEFLGIKKWEPPIPTGFAGDVVNIGTEYTVKFDVENIQKYPNVFQEGEEVEMTEKLHGSFMGIGYFPDLDNHNFYQNSMFCFSKGLGSQGLVFKYNDNNRKSNLYVRVMDQLISEGLYKNLEDYGYLMILLGEVFGPGVQDLHYGNEKPSFRVFDVVWFEDPYTVPEFLHPFEVNQICEYLGLNKVPTIYNGPFSNEVVNEHKNGQSTLAGHIREGVVIRPKNVRYDEKLGGRVMLKAISEAYLLRKNGTEFN